MLKACTTDIAVSFIDLQSFGPFNTTEGKDADDIGIWISFNSQECALSLSSTILKTNDVKARLF